MLQSKARWKINESDETTIHQLVATFGLHPLVAKLLVVRGITGTEQAELFLHAGVERFHDPFLLDGMEAAVARIQRALAGQEKIRIYGDYDADGVSSTCLMIYLFRQLEASFGYYIPHRVNEGYGLNCHALDDARKHGVTLLVTVDTGISAWEEIEYANEIGIDVIVTDHHEPPERLPQAYAVINPKKSGCPYPFKQLAGVGVAFKLAHALLGRLPLELLEMAAIGTVADLMPLVDENRLLVKLGLERMRISTNFGIKALLGIAGVERKDVTASHIGYALAPRINASGRLHCADDAVRLLTTTSEQEAEHLAYDLDVLNKERQRIVEEMTKDALQMAGEQAQSEGTADVIVLSQEDWNVGVIGIVASKIVEKYYRPTIILGIDAETGLAKGSARSIAGFDIHKALTKCSDLLEHYGGHQAAAGMTLKRELIPELRHRLQKLAKQWLTKEDFIPILHADAACDLQEVPLECIRQLEDLAPFGMGNPAPRFVFTGLQVNEMKTIGKERQHLKLMLAQTVGETACTIEAIGFGRGAIAEAISLTAQVDVLGELSVNEWNGNRKPQIVIQDIRVPDPQLFDWRGSKSFEQRWAMICARNNRASTGKLAQETGIVVFSAIEKPRIPESLTVSGSSLWIVQHSGIIQPLNASAQSASFAELQEVAIYSLPSRIEDLQNVLREAHQVERIYALFTDEEPEASTLPSRDMFKNVYAAISQQSGIGANDLNGYFSKRSGLSKTMIQFITEVFEELSLIERNGQGYRCVSAPIKRELNTSQLYQNRLHRQRVEQLLIYTSAQELSRWCIEELRQTNRQLLEASV